MTDETKALVNRLRNAHNTYISVGGERYCWDCGEPVPCGTHLLCDALEVTEGRRILTGTLVTELEAENARLREGLRQVRAAAIEGDARVSRESGGDSCGATALYGIRMITDHVLNDHD